jgi:hypothetical protein
LLCVESTFGFEADASDSADLGLARAGVPVSVGVTVNGALLTKAYGPNKLTFFAAL